MATARKRGGSYTIIASCGYDLQGKQIRKNLTWTPEPGMTERQIAKELERQKVLFEEKCRTGQVLDGSIRFADFAEQWFEKYGKKNLRTTTYRRYLDEMPRINAAIGHIRLDRLQPLHLLSFYDNLAEAGVRKDTTYRCKINLKAYLAERKCTQTRFAARAEVSMAVIKSIYQGKNISKHSAECVSGALGRPVCDLFDAIDRKPALSQNTILHHHRVISTILSTAVKWQVIFANPCERLDPPKSDTHEAQYLDDKQALRLLELLEEEHPQNRTMIELLLYTGMRRGELCGLEWQDIDFEHEVIHIRRSSLYLPEHGIFIDNTKNETSTRSIKISHSAAELLRSFRAWQLQERLRLGDQWHDCGRVFTSWCGRPIHPSVVTSWFHRFVAAHDLPPVSIHSLRHTNATLLIASNTNIQTVANRLGHKHSTTTQKIYTHAIKAADAVAAETLQDILHPAHAKKKA